MTLDVTAEAPDDFDFLLGEWLVRHRRLKDRLVGSDQWIEFDGRMSNRKVLGGYGNVEEHLLPLPEATYHAIAVRSFNPHSRTWSIWWLDGRFPDQIDAPVVGRFDNDTGTFYGDGSFNGTPVRIRFIWTVLDRNHPRWEQAFSTDGGITWETNWIMEFARVRGSATPASTAS